GEGVAVTLGQVRIRVANIEGEDLVGEANTDVPGVVARLRDAARERPAERGCDRRAVERIRGAQPLTAEFARDVHADAGGAEGGRRCGPLAGDRGVVAPRAEVEEIR